MSRRQVTPSLVQVLSGSRDQGWKHIYRLYSCLHESHGQWLSYTRPWWTSVLSHAASTGACRNSALTWCAATCPQVLKLLISFFTAWMWVRQFFNKAEMDSPWWNLGFLIPVLLMRVCKELGYVLCLYLCLGKHRHLLLTCLREFTLCILRFPTLYCCHVRGRESQSAINIVIQSAFRRDSLAESSAVITISSRAGDTLLLKDEALELLFTPISCGMAGWEWAALLRSYKHDNMCSHGRKGCAAKPLL